jgi:hypothetical protein
MPFNWHDYVDLAHYLVANPPPGVSAGGTGRSIVSRAYYGAFCYARNYARDYLGFVPSNSEKDHGGVRDHLRRKRRQRTADVLDRLRDSRNEWDYLDDLWTALTKMLPQAILDADYVFRSLPPPAKPSKP